MRFRVDFAASLPKDLNAPALNEDAWAHDESLTCIALSDGASESFDSKSWARLLVDRYAHDQEFTPGWVSGAVKEYVSRVNFEELGWAQQRAFDRGSFATLLGLKLAENDADLDILCVGDCLGMHVRNGIVLGSYPFTHPEQFDARPSLISTKSASNAFLSEPDFFGNFSRTWTVEHGDIILAATDALGQWALSEVQAAGSGVGTLLAINTVDEFTELVMQCRANQQMKLDDSTMLRLVVEKDGI